MKINLKDYSIFNYKILLIAFAILLTACGSNNSTSEQQRAINKIVAYAESDGTTTAPTVDDYRNAGVAGVNADNLEAANTIVSGLNGEDVDTSHEIQWNLCESCNMDETTSNTPDFNDKKPQKQISLKL